MDKYIEMFKDYAVEFGTKLVIAALVLIIGLWVTKIITKTVSKILNKGDLDKSLCTFLTSILGMGLKILVIITALSQLGMQMTSFVALIGAAGLAVGMAFSGTLSNFAGGVMILVLRPFKVGDYIEAQGENGTVDEIQIFHTTLKTVDNKVIYIPNGSLANGNLTNYSHQDTRRVDFTVGIGYGDQYDKAKEVLERFIKEDSRIMNTPEPFIGLTELADSSVNIALRVWTKKEDYWPVYFAMNEKIYKEFDKEGLNIPFPQMDIHVHKD